MFLSDQPENFRNLFLDMNAFFASVEQQVQPQLRGKPICVAPYIGATGCCIAKSYEAKRQGVKTGTLVGEAKRICPQIHIQEARPELYMFYHKQILKVLNSISPYVKVLSVDEFVIKLTGSDRNETKARDIAKSIKSGIQSHVGDYLTCSVGLGPNQWLAKVAGELKKPDGLEIITLESLPVIYRILKLTDLPGINTRMARQLKRRRIFSPLDFYNASCQSLSAWFGHPGKVWHFRLRGFETDEFTSPTKTIGHSHVLAPALRNPSGARKVMLKLSEKAGKRLRDSKLWANGLSIGIGFLNGGYLEQHSRTGPFFDQKTITDLVAKLYDKCFFQKPPMILFFRLYDLVKPQGTQLSILPEIQKNKDLSLALDKINDQFGANSIFPAAMLGGEESAPNRIPFGQPRYEI